MSLRRVIPALAVAALLVSPPAAQPATEPIHALELSHGPRSRPVVRTDPDRRTALPEGRLVASAREDTLNVRRRPQVAAGVRFAVSATNPWGQRIRFLVTKVQQSPRKGIWLRLSLGVQPNGASGWVRLGDVKVSPIRDRIVVDLSARVLRHFHGGDLEHRFRIGIGAMGTPSTQGRFFVWASLAARPSGSYGSYVLGLSGFSEVLTGWAGGGRMAIHGTDDPTDRGHAVSHGCLRVYNPQMLELRHIPMGTPVVIRR